MENFLCELLCSFRKTHPTQNAFLKILQKWQAELDSGDYVGTVLMDLPKTCGCLSHDLLILKLDAYGLHIGSLKFLLDYLSSRERRNKVGFWFSK